MFIYLPSLRTLELGVLPFVKELPSWLSETEVYPVTQSRHIFRIQNSCFCLTKKESLKPYDVFRAVHSRAIRKVATSDYAGALAALEVSNFGVPKLDGFLLQEKSIAKRMTGDLPGALEDLTAALDCFDKAGDGHHNAYDCWKHRGYVNFLMGDLEGAQNDGMVALKLQLEGVRETWGQNLNFLGEESIEYMNFTLAAKRDFMAHRKLMLPSHKEVMKKVKACDFRGALASFDVINVGLLSHPSQAFFFQERGILKRLAEDLGGALADLTRGLEIDDDDYDCYKHRGYVRFLLGDQDGARMDAEKCLTLNREPDSFMAYLGGIPVQFLEYNLK